jgi:hypothetical protein
LLIFAYPWINQKGGRHTPRIAKQEWDVVALLAYQIQSRRVQGAGDRLLSSLLEFAIQLARQERWNMLLFAARCLESIVPSPAVRRAVMSACTQACVMSDLVPRPRTAAEGTMAMVAAVLSTSPENRPTAGEVVEQILNTTVQSGTDREGAAAYEVAFRLRAPIFYRRIDSGVVSEALQFWSDVGNRIMAACLPCLERLAIGDLQVASLAYEAGDLSLGKIVEWHGIAGLFRAPHSHTFLVWWPAFAVRLLARLSRVDTPGDEKLEQELQELGRILVSVEPPWVEWSDTRMGMEYRYFVDDVIHSPSVELRPSAPPPEAAFATFGILAVLLEGSDEGSRLAISGWIERIDSPLFAAISAAQRSRFDLAGGSRRIPSIGPKYDDLVTRWAASQLSFAHLVGTGKRADSDHGSDQVTLPLTERTDDTD